MAKILSSPVRMGRGFCHPGAGRRSEILPGDCQLQKHFCRSQRSGAVATTLCERSTFRSTTWKIPIFPPSRARHLPRGKAGFGPCVPITASNGEPVPARTHSCLRTCSAAHGSSIGYVVSDCVARFFRHSAGPSLYLDNGREGSGNFTKARNGQRMRLVLNREGRETIPTMSNISTR